MSLKNFCAHFTLLSFAFLLLEKGALAAQPVIIENVRVISSTELKVSNPTDIKIEKGIIREMGSGLQHENAITIDGTDKYLSAGFIDSHVHLGSTAGMREDQAESRVDLLTAFRNQEPRSFLYFGFTTLVDLNQSETFVEKWREMPASPDLIYCKSAPFTNGYGMAFTPEKYRFQSPYFIYDEAQKRKIPKDVIAAEHTPKRVVEKVAKTGASCIKTFHESGFGGLWDWPTPSDDIIRQIGQLAAEHNLLHFHHSTSLASHRQSADANVSVLAHGLWHWEELSSSLELPEEITTILDKIIENEAFYQPTSQVLGGELALYDTQFLHQANLQHSLPPSLIAWHKEGNSDWFLNKLNQRIADNPHVVERFLGKKPSGEKDETSRVAMNRLTRIVNYLAKNDANLVLASDTPSSPTYTNPPGLNGLLEIKNMHDMGLSMQKIYQMVTINNATMLGLESSIGDVRVGMKANLLLLNNNPLENIEAYDQIDMVILNGKPAKRTEFSAAN